MKKSDISNSGFVNKEHNSIWTSTQENLSVVLGTRIVADQPAHRTVFSVPLLLYYLCKVGIKNMSLAITIYHHSESILITNRDSWDDIFIPLVPLLHIYSFIIPHVNFPYKTSIDEQLIFYDITCCYSNGEYHHVFAIAAGDIIKYQGSHT